MMDYCISVHYPKWKYFGRQCHKINSFRSHFKGPELLASDKVFVWFISVATGVYIECTEVIREKFCIKTIKLCFLVHHFKVCPATWGTCRYAPTPCGDAPHAAGIPYHNCAGNNVSCSSLWQLKIFCGGIPFPFGFSA